MTRLTRLAWLLASCWFYGEWKAETPNEREMESIMRELGYWPTTEKRLVEELPPCV